MHNFFARSLYLTPCFSWNATSDSKSVSLIFLGQANLVFSFLSLNVEIVLILLDKSPNFLQIPVVPCFFL